MSFNKAKAKRNAERYLTQGKIQAAIREYRQIVDNDPRDVNTQNVLGDLYAKAENEKDAVMCYRRVADYYHSQGFAKKAIAIYNKIHKIEPRSIEVSSKLAELYSVRGSLAEAKEHYETVAAHYEKKGNRIEALSIWENIAELDPGNAEIYLKIAESYWQDERSADATDAFVKAGERLVASNKHESAVAAFSRALEITPLDLDAMEGVVRAQIELGYPEEAAKSLEQRIENDPYDKESNFLLVECYYDMDNPAAAEQVIVKMVERDPSNYHKFLELIDVYLKEDDLDSVIRVLSMITEHMLVGGEHEALLVVLEEVLARNPEHIAALRLLARYHSWLKDEIELKGALERVAESARINGSDEDEKYALSQLTMLVPHDTAISDRLEFLGGPNEDHESVIFTKDSATGEAPDYQSYDRLSQDEDSTINGLPVDNTEKQEFAGVDMTDNGFAFDGSSGEIGVASEVEDTLEAEIVNEQDIENSVAEDIGIEAREVEVTNGASAVEAESVGGENLQDGSPSQANFPQLNAADEMRLEEEIESIKFYIDQGYNGLADKSLSELEVAFGNRPEIIELREALGGESHAHSVSEDSVEQPETIADVGVAVLPEEAAGDDLSSEQVLEDVAEATNESVYYEGTEHAVEELDEESINELSEPEEQVEEFEVTAEITDEVETSAEVVGSAAEESEDASFADEEVESIAEDTVDANQEHAEYLDQGKEELSTDEPIDEPPEDFAEASNTEFVAEVSDQVFDDESIHITTPDADRDNSNSYENFRNELSLHETEDPVEDEFENHYQPAVAYQEMGLMEEAIREFQDAVNAVKPDDGSHRFLNCCTLLGHCFIQKGMPNLGIVWFKRAFEVPGLDQEELNGLHYELANAFEKSGEPENAIEEFEKIYAVDVDYRDISDRMAKLRELTLTNA